MRYLIAIASTALLLAFAASPSIADDQSAGERARHRMGDEGKLPASGATNSRVPDMGAVTGTGSGTEGSSLRMGDDGKLPATDSMSGEVPKMQKPQQSGD
ncbi:hypothetical protein DLM45_08510 [Hyphomicrobium methylovorum]|uniref:hypothetical protein n=1 Tax=Hyphomicrobium methylovorum TaxID=84 RepID=UPI0015E787E9|nr:hypothetical protein [Hyphomicrobium methylovorum]MBA2126264.1 hypothetical protein [Hyphomicrobium methylovorum]